MIDPPPPAISLPTLQNPPAPDRCLTELEARLALANGVQTRSVILARLSEMEWRLRNQMAASVPRDQYPLYASVADALTCAKEILAEWPVTGQAVVHTGSGLPVPAMQSSNHDNRSA